MSFLACLLGAAISAASASDRPFADWEQEFLNPPNSARMWTWWFWLDNRVDETSITEDLEGIKSRGLAGVTVFGLAGRGMTNRGPDFLSARWDELFRHTLREADRLGLCVSATLCSGWNAGGPWVEPEQACKRVVSSQLAISGPRHFKERLPLPPADQRFYKDIVIQALRVNAPYTNSDPKSKALLDYKTARDSFGHFDQTPIAEIRAAPLKLLEAAPGQPVLDVTNIVDLTRQCDQDGILDWKVPAGDWVVLRTGCTLTGARTIIPAPGGAGLESDPFDAHAMDLHFKQVGEHLARLAGPLSGRVFQSVQIDSWEINPLPNWTLNLPREFKARRGYDFSPYLPALAGYLVTSPEMTDRFLYDYRQTLAECIADNYYGRLSTLAAANGLLQQSEAGGVCYPKVMAMDALKNLGRCAIPMGEFWQDGRFQESGQNKNGKQTASAAHVYGKNIAAAEAFTTFGHWIESPATLKPTADRAFCEGINSVCVFSTATASGDGFPGTEFHAGTHFNRKITWWEQARPFADYIARCCYLLQQGKFVADVLYYNGDGAPNYVAPKQVDPALGPGYDYDVCNTEVLLSRLAVHDGKLVLPDGMSYRILALPNRTDMPKKVILKLKELIEAGATVAGPRPDRTPGLERYPAADRELRDVARNLWGGCDGQKVTENKCKGGRVVWGRSLRDLLASDSICPDFAFSGGKPDSFIDWIHRRADGADIYFLVNRHDRLESIAGTFRVTDRQPEIWDPVSGHHWDALSFTSVQAGTTVPLEIGPHGSLFVLFRKPIQQAGSNGKLANFPKFTPLLELNTDWDLSFDPNWGGPAQVKFEQLVDWTSRPEEGIRYYSGKATYRKTFDWSATPGSSGSTRRIVLDLGEVNNLAAVRLNGRDLGIVWCRPWRVEITGALREGNNQLEIDVVNLWPNRLIRDGKLPVERRLTTTNIRTYDPRKNGPEHALLASGLLGPVVIQIEH